MQVICPQCGKPIPTQDLNVASDIALCRLCGQTHVLSELVRAKSDDASRVDIAHPPPGAWCRTTEHGREIGATTRSPIAFFLVPFFLVWSGGSLGGIYGTQIASGHFNLITSLFGIPFILGTVFLCAMTLMGIGGKVTVTLSRQGGEVFTGIGSVGVRRRFRLDEIATVREVQSPFSHPGYQHYGGIVLEGKRRIRFGHGLNEARRYFVVEALRQELSGTGMRQDDRK